MQIKQIKLENIRSYTNQVIDFPSNSVLLSGDIGSGKSTILLAIEFALFGIRGKQLSGASLLRNGKNKASVELNFMVDNQEVIIKRNLKRRKDSIAQETGFIIIDGIKTDATAIELKTKILDLLGYPKELLSKTKNLIYRFTVYTPQEEMKHILMESAEERLDTLRKVFGIDKYKRINQNADIIIKEIKSKIKEMNSSILDLDEKQKLKQNKEENIIEINKKIKIIIPELNNINKKIEEQRSNIKNIEEKVKRFNEASRRLSSVETDLNNKLELRRNNSEKIRLLEKEINSLKKEIKDIKEDINIENKENEISLIRNTIKSIENKISEFNALKKNSENIKKKIIELDSCPTCHQDVSEEYKNNIVVEENTKINETNENINNHSEQLKQAEDKLKVLEQEIELLRRKQTEIRINKIKLENLKNKENEIEFLNKQQDEIKKNVGVINIEKIALNKEIDDLKNIQKDFTKQRELLEQLNENQNKLDKEKAVLETESFQIQKSVDELKTEIKNKLSIKNKKNKYSQMQNWLDSFFVKLISEIEKNIMTNAYLQFNDLFEQWFNMLIEDESINIRLDENFSPVVNQNGYEASIEHLSGGERTAAALAYRLALNKVINNMITGIKTRDLIILDEPTDGFSTEQLDKVRDVLEQINANQLIIVSHENKIESFVDEIIRINKNEHISSLI